MDDPVLKPADLIPASRNSFPRRRYGGESRQDTKEVRYGIGFPAALRRGVSTGEKEKAVSKDRKRPFRDSFQNSLIC
jgi:hypothetical protein